MQFRTPSRKMRHFVNTATGSTDAKLTASSEDRWVTGSNTSLMIMCLNSWKKHFKVLIAGKWEYGNFPNFVTQVKWFSTLTSYQRNLRFALNLKEQFDISGEFAYLLFFASSFRLTHCCEKLLFFSRWGATDLPAQGGGMMSGGGSSLNGILETEKVKRERFVSTVTIHQPNYKATCTETFSHSRRLPWTLKVKKIYCEDGQEGGSEGKGGAIQPNERVLHKQIK